MPDPSIDTTTEPNHEIQVVLSTKMIETVNVPIAPLLVRFAVPEDWFLPEVQASQAVSPAPAAPSATTHRILKMSTMRMRINPANPTGRKN